MNLDQIRSLPCVMCGKTPCDVAHIKTRGSGGDDTFENVLPLCRGCHTLQHKVGFVKLWDTSQKMRFALSLRGWQVDEEFGLRKLRKKDGAAYGQTNPAPMGTVKSSD